MIAPSGAFYTLERLLVIGESSLTQPSRAHLDVLFQSSEVQTDSLLIEIPVLADLEAGVTEDGSVVTP